MYQEERLAAIMERLKSHKRVSVQEICDLYDVSRDTARRDLVRLEEQGAILRTRGGAILPQQTKKLPNYTERLQLVHEGKHQIAALASTLVKDGEYLIMDGSTTVQFTAERLQSSGNVVVTNSVEIAGIFASKERAVVHLLGGVYHPEHRFVYGHRTTDMLAQYHVDKAILGTCGISREGLTTYSEEECYVLKEMIRRSDQVILLTDHSKFHVKLFMHVADWSEIDILVTDQEPDAELAEVLDRYEVKVMVAERVLDREEKEEK